MRFAFARLSPVLGSLALGWGCGPMVVLEDDTGEPSEAEATGDTGSPTTTSPTSTSTTGTTSPGTATVTSSTTSLPEPTTAVDPTDGEPGLCAQVCASSADCVPVGGNPDEFACIDGFCEYVAVFTCDEMSCPPEAGLACATIEGTPTCVVVCSEVGNECEVFESECAGVSEEGILYCELGCGPGIDEGEPCDYPGFGQLGICIDGRCGCTDDTECTAEGFACNA